MKKLFKNKFNSKTAIGTVGLAVIISIAIAKHPSDEKNTFVPKHKVAPPLKNVDIDYKNYSVDAKRGLVLRYYETGSVISIPANAFVDQEGKLITGAVDIKYREFHNPSDFFVSGIPMTYDSAGTQYQFESAGMLEILAFQKGKPVFVNPAKKIIVEMLSQQGEDKYNIYNYNSVTGNWKYAYKDRAIAIDTNKQGDKKNAPLSFLANRNKKSKANTDLLIPQKSNEQKFHFDVAIDSAEFPEIALYKGIEFEVYENENDFDPTYASTTWNDI